VVLTGLLLDHDLKLSILSFLFADHSGGDAKSQGVKHVVGISALGRGTPWAANAGFVTASLKMDDLIAGTGVNYRAVINPSFMDNLLRQVQEIKSQGAFFLPISGDLKQPSACTRDIAATAAKLLLDDSWSGVASKPVLGPEDLSDNDMARIMSEVLGKPVRFQQIPDEAFKTRVLQNGMSEAMAEGVLDTFSVGSSVRTFFRPSCWLTRTTRPQNLHQT
jgi:uncharacterized protein YbjT (DUF2867 family)